MLKRVLAVSTVCILLITAGCSGITSETNDGQKNTVQDTDSPIDNKTNASKYGNESKNESDNTTKTQNYTRIFELGLNKTKLNKYRIDRGNNTLEVLYYGDFSNNSRTTRELSFVAASFAEVVNKSYNSKTNWGISRLHVIGKSANGSVVWDSIIEDWWAMNYIKDNWSFNNYIDAIVASGELWNITVSQPPQDGDRYIDKIDRTLQIQTNITVLSLNKHGGEAFLTYETDHELNSSQYFDEVANVVDVYKNLTLPRSLNRTDGWFAGVLNMEVRNGNDTLEWYRYQIRWAEARVKGGMTRQEEAYRLRRSRFLEKDRLRDTPDPDE